MRCKHPVVQLLWRWFGTWIDHQPRLGNNSHDAAVCKCCGAWLSLSHSDEHASERIEIEIRLAELLAETECFWEPCGAKDEQFDLYVDIFATDEPPQQLRKTGPRSPIEMMVDAACGYEHPESDR